MGVDTASKILRECADEAEAAMSEFAPLSDTRWALSIYVEYVSSTVKEMRDLADEIEDEKSRPKRVCVDDPEWHPRYYKGRAPQYRNMQDEDEWEDE